MSATLPTLDQDEAEEVLFIIDRVKVTEANAIEAIARLVLMARRPPPDPPA